MRTFKFYTLFLLSSVVMMPVAHAQMFPSNTTPGQVNAGQNTSNMGFEDDDNGDTLSDAEVMKRNNMQKQSMYMGFDDSPENYQRSNSSAGPLAHALSEGDKEFKDKNIPYGSEVVAGGKWGDKDNVYPYGAEFIKEVSADDYKKAVQLKTGDPCKDPYVQGLPKPSEREKSIQAVPMEESGSLAAKIEDYGSETKWGKTERCAEGPFPLSQARSGAALAQVYPSSTPAPSAGFDPSDDVENGQMSDDLQNVNNSSAQTGPQTQTVAQDVQPTPDATPHILDPMDARRSLVKQAGILRPSPDFTAFVARLSDDKINHVIAVMKQIRMTDPNRVFGEDDVKLLSSI